MKRLLAMLLRLPLTVVAVFGVEKVFGLSFNGLFISVHICLVTAGLLILFGLGEELNRGD